MTFLRQRLTVLTLGLVVCAFSTLVAAQAAGPQGQVVTSGPIVSAGTNKCLDVPSNEATRDGANVQQYDCSGRPNQTWQIVQVAPDSYAIVNQGSRMVLDVSGQNRANGAHIDQRHWSSQQSQLWKVQHTGADTFTLVNSGTGKCLDLSNGSAANGTSIQQYDCSGAPNQTWRMNAAPAVAAAPAAAPGTPAATQGIGPNISSPQQEQAERAVHITQAPAVTKMGANSAVLHWKTNALAANSVKYGTDPNNLTQTAYEPGGGTDHSLTLKNLAPGQTYYYQILTRDGDVRFSGQFQN